jgi:hypothetical protein
MPFAAAVISAILSLKRMVSSGTSTGSGLTVTAGTSV